ncbi:hypothetical protein DL98DRAFT_605669 [Cadophora sp. DSE1049]|nr:hypothetical protein DL98DRAFT_605669 [Cadophora sp. DSE1049]
MIFGSYSWLVLWLMLTPFDAHRILTFSNSASIIVGPEKQTFNVPQDLLALHSTFFREHFTRAEQKIVLPAISAADFAEFVSWIYQLSLPSEPLYTPGENFLMAPERGWELGRLLGAPGYQNDGIQTYQDYCRDNLDHWPDVLTIRTIYTIRPSSSKLRKFAADSMATHSPLRWHTPGSPELTEWDALLKEFPELSIDIVYASAKGWNGTLPWDDDNLDAYMEDETQLDQAWEEQILAKWGIDDIRNEAEKKCIRSIFELAHLERNKDT